MTQLLTPAIKLDDRGLAAVDDLSDIAVAAANVNVAWFSGGREILHVFNGDATATTVTALGRNSDDNIVMSVPAGAWARLPLLPPAKYGFAGQCRVTLSKITDCDLALVGISRAR
jgi:hypothetical protein